MATWPLSLPQSPQHASLGEELGYPVIQAPVDGPPLARRAYTAAPDSVHHSYFMTNAQLGIFEDWYRNEIASGALPYTAPGRRGIGTATYRIVEAPRVQRHGIGWIVGMSLTRMVGVGGPVSLIPPVITGTWAIGGTLTTSDGTWSGEPPTFTYQWLRDGVPIEGATNKTYALTSDDAYKRISAQVRAANNLGEATATSAEKLFNMLEPVLAQLAEHGYLLDLSDPTTLWQDVERTIPVTAVGQTVACIDDITGNGNHFIQATPSKRAVWARVPATGRRNLFNDSATLTGSWIIGPAGKSEIEPDVVRFTKNLNNNLQPYQIVTVSPGARVVFSIRARRGSLTNAAMRWYNNTANSVISTPNYYAQINADTFTRIEFELVVPAECTSLRIYPVYGSSNDRSGTIDLTEPQIEVAAAGGATTYQRVVSAYDITEPGVRDLHGLLSDGVDDSYATAGAVAMGGSDKITIGSGFCATSNVSIGTLIESSIEYSSNDGSFALLAPRNVGSLQNVVYSRGTTIADRTTSSIGMVPTTLVAVSDISAPLLRATQNGLTPAPVSDSQGAGPFLDRVHYYGGRNNNNRFFTGYRFADYVNPRLLTVDETAALTAWLDYRTGRSHQNV